MERRSQMDLKNPKWMVAKAILFLLIGTVSVALVLIERPSIKVAILLALMIWSFSRAYYFAFYVIEKYIDANFRFSGLTSVVLYLIRKRRNP